MRHLPVDCCYCAECGVCGTHKSVSARCAAGLSGCAPCFVPNHGHWASIPHAFAPAALRAPLASRGKPCGLSPPRDAWRSSMPPNRLRGSARPAPRRNRRARGAALWLAAAGCAIACRPRCWRFVVCTSRRMVHRHTARPRYGASMPHLKPVRKLRQGRSCLVIEALTRPASGRKPMKPSHGDAESAMSPFGSGRPVRPCLVVNPGGGAAAPWAL